MNFRVGIMSSTPRKVVFLGLVGGRCMQVAHALSALSWTAPASTVWRPTIDDVDRISWGRPAKRKGTGSRGVPHRLNDEAGRHWGSVGERPISYMHMCMDMEPSTTCRSDPDSARRAMT